MAATPLFAQSLDSIKSGLRLSSVPDSSADTLRMIDDSVARARLSIYRRLGRVVVNRVLATAEVAAPDTDDEIRRSVASQLELNLVLVDLLRRLPNAFMDASGDLQRRWNEEAPFRERPRSDREREISRLNDEIEEAYQLLEKTDDVPGDAPNVLTLLVDPDVEPQLPGDTILRSPFEIPRED